MKEPKKENRVKIVEKDIYGEPLTASYEDYLIESLKNPREAKEYLNAALENESKDHRAFLLALRNIADAFGMTKLADETGLDRANIYRMLSPKGNPTIRSIFPLLQAIGIRLSIELAKSKNNVKHYKLEIRQGKPAMVTPTYAKPTAQRAVGFPIPSSVYRPYVANCELQITA